MLMVINPLNIVFENKSRILDGRPLDMGCNYYVLDTDDMAVETTDFNGLWNAIVGKGIEVWNVRCIEGMLFFRLSDWSFLGLSGNLILQGGKIAFTGKSTFVFPNIQTNISVVGSRRGLDRQIIYFYVGGQNVYAWEDVISVSCTRYILYMYKIGEYYVVRVKVELDRGLGARHLLYTIAVVLTNDGRFMSLLPDKDLPPYEGECEDPGFMAKFKMLGGRRY